MNVFQIKGGKRLEGVVDVGGSKNTCLAIMSAVVLAEGKTVLTNVPQLSDTRIKANLLERFGAKVSWNGNRVEIDCTNIYPGETDEETVRAILLAPEQGFEVRPGRVVLQSKVSTGQPGRAFLVRVFVDIDRRPAEVVTAYRTSKIEKYWRKP